MAANLNALGIIFAPIFAIIISLIWGTKPDKERITSTIVFPSILIFLLFILTPSLLSNPPQISDFPFYQIFIPIISLYPILLFIKDYSVRYCNILILILLAFGLLWQFNYLSNHGKYSERNPEKNKAHIARAFAVTKNSITETLLTHSEHDSNSYPEGWLSQSPLMAIITESAKDNINDKILRIYNNHYTHYLWHSFFTHIYGINKDCLNTESLGIWYPGGKLSFETISQISLRERHIRHPRISTALTNASQKLIAQNNLKLLAISMMLYGMENRDSNSYPNGWLSESPIILNLPQYQQQNLTDNNAFIFDCNGKNQEIWYSGGKISDANISLRDR